MLFTKATEHPIKFVKSQSKAIGNRDYKYSAKNCKVLPMLLRIAVVFLLGNEAWCVDAPPFQFMEGYRTDAASFPSGVLDCYRKPVVLKNLRGNVVIVHFFTTWCPSCPEVLKSLDRLLGTMRQRNINNVRIIALNVGVEDNHGVREHYARHGIKNLSIYESVSADELSLVSDAIPVCIVFDQEGNFLFKYIGGDVDFSSPTSVKYFTNLVSEYKHSDGSANL
jgi:thiol-disulfide isomerase/thioredoxin